jgi:hypothetical protein
MGTVVTHDPHLTGTLMTPIYRYLYQGKKGEPVAVRRNWNIVG